MNVRFSSLAATCCLVIGCGSSSHSPDDQGPPSTSSRGGTGADPSKIPDATSTGGQAGSSGAAGSGSDPAKPPDRDYTTDPREMMPDAGTTDSVEPAGDPAYFRITELLLREPRFILTGTDITDMPLLGTSVNGTLIPGGLTMDYDADTFLDVSIVVGFEALDPSAATGSVQLMDAHCLLSDPTRCAPHPSPGLDATWTTENQTDGTCLEPIEGTTSVFDFAGTLPKAPCFTSTEEHDVVMNVSGIRLELSAAQVAASYDGAGPDRLVHGMIRGFLTVESATSALLPSYLLLFAGSPLSDYLADAERDMAQSPNGKDGWWVYLGFTAEPVDYSAP